jgi:lysylphosphatidylglycerol synthetase-like protein (DUF2156 family)
MENSPRLCYLALVGAVGFTIATFVSYNGRDRGDADVLSLSEMEIFYVAVALGLVIFAVQGLISVLVEGRRLFPGLVAPRLTEPLSLAIVLFSLALFAIAITLSIAVADDWSVRRIGILAGVGCILLATLLIFYKEAFVGDEAHFDDREDGVPW